MGPMCGWRLQLPAQANGRWIILSEPPEHWQASRWNARRKAMRPCGKIGDVLAAGHERVD